VLSEKLPAKFQAVFTKIPPHLTGSTPVHRGFPDSFEPAQALRLCAERKEGVHLILIYITEYDHWKGKMYFYEKRYARPDGKTLGRRYSRSFEYGERPSGLKPEQLHGEDSKNTSKVASLRPNSQAIESSISRARSRVRVLSFSNPQLTGLLTLTFKDIPTESESARRFNLYRKKVARHHPGWQFLGVKELQKRGSIHFHLLVNFCPAQVHRPLSNRPLQQQSDLWDYGISDFRLIEGDDKFRIELYLLKYLTKNTEKLFKTYYVRSRNLNDIKPTYISDRLPYPDNIEHIYTTIISNNYVEKFEITEYTYNRYNHKKGVKNA